MRYIKIEGQKAQFFDGENCIYIKDDHVKSGVVSDEILRRLAESLGWLPSNYCMFEIDENICYWDVFRENDWDVSGASYSFEEAYKHIKANYWRD
jgi:hypothetical protein